MNVSELLARNGRKYPNREAVISGGERLSYKELNSRVNKLADALRTRGYEKGDRILLFMPNVSEFVVTYFAAIRIGALIVPVNSRLTASELGYILEHSGARALFAHEMLVEQTGTLNERPGLECVKTGAAAAGWASFEELVTGGRDMDAGIPLMEDDEAAILYTSGTTGNPKGVLFTHRNILSAAIMMAVEMSMQPESRMLHLMPLSHSAPLHLFLIAGTYVGTAHIMAPIFTPEVLLKLVSSEKATHFFGAPVAYLFTAKQPDIEKYDLSSMEYWVYGGAPLGEKEVRLVKERLKTDSLYCVYGLTEAGPSGTLLLAGEHGQKAGSIGKRAALGTEIMIADEKGNPVEPGEAGEILLKGEGVMKGYYKDSEKTAETIKDGWLYSGDMARYDKDGYIWVVDRKKDMIISGGVNIFPKEIEELLASHPAIAETAVVGVPHPEWGETVKAYVVLKQPGSLDESELKAFLSGKIADYKIPKLYEEIEALPRNATGKILKQSLRQQKQSV
ncbi:long-chain fatty acid--CoA ligase [Bacillus infantis]|uniref:class I adenylate-forming enzyme family protein n=1 Tax=Bacillus infantis TaxID=324767 RepID=UPI001CD3754C|nr:long-chain fatty acid--CoA ligase [Bacillus infantis]MCA1035634.1 long-chain fatty acid--CoA ligase [Bacillus infantis]